MAKLKSKLNPEDAIETASAVYALQDSPDIEKVFDGIKVSFIMRAI